MLERPDYAALLAGHHEIMEMVNAGQGGLPALTRLLHRAWPALRAAGLAFVERGPHTSSVIAAVGAAEWTLGRSVRHPAGAGRIGGADTQEFAVEELFDERPGPAHGEPGAQRVLVAGAVCGERVIGALHVFSASRLAPEFHRAAAYVASSIASLCGRHSGLSAPSADAVLAALPTGLAVIDQDNRIQYWNSAAERYVGRPAAEALGQPLPFPAPTPGQSLDHQLPHRGWVRLAAEDIPGSPGSRIITIHDITDQRRREQERDLFLAATSHELRTPITAIKGYADTLSEHWDALPESERRRAARIVGQRAGELTRLVDRLLTVASDLGATGAKPEPFDVLDALRDAVHQLPTDLRRRLVLRLPVHLPKAVGERATLATVLTELATNAQKYSPEGTPIELTAESDDQTVVLRVSDRGIGVRPEHVERAFERFWQGESDDRRHSGAGLGLYLVRQIVERQNGWVSLRPRDGGGTIAEVRLPRG